MKLNIYLLLVISILLLFCTPTTAQTSVSDTIEYFEVQPAVTRYKNPKPLELPTIDDELERGSYQSSQIKIQEIVPAIQFEENNNSSRKPLQNNTNTKLSKLSLNFFGTLVRFHIPKKIISTVNTTNNKNITTQWKLLNQTSYSNFIDELRNTKRNINLDDGGICLLLFQIADSCFRTENARSVFVVFTLNKLGYKAKVGEWDSKLIPLLVFQNQLYGRSFLVSQGLKYYVFGNHKESKIKFCNVPEQEPKFTMFLQMKTPVNLAIEQAKNSEQVKQDKSMPFTFNRNIIDFYNRYPQTDIQINVNTPISQPLLENIEKYLKPLLPDNEEKAVQVIFDFVRNTFPYKTDIAQFGKEKSFFAEELFYYPYADCEDKAVLFTQLVRHFLNLKVVILDYSDHIATAVKFSKPAEGDYITIGKDEYVICDPTNTSKIGRAGSYKTTKTKVLLLS